MTRARQDTHPAQSVYLPREGLDLVPVFHARGEYQRIPATIRAGAVVRAAGDELRTRCGLVVYRYRSGEGAWIDRTHLRLDHAEAIGTPCQRCWPPVAS